jgi:hypothetical protein
MWEGDLRSQKRRSLDNEKRLSEEIGFECTSGSGNQPWALGKGDGKHPQFMFECKETSRASITIKERDISKLVKEARTAGKDPVLILSAYGISDGIPKEWVAVPTEVFKGILSQVEGESGDNDKFIEENKQLKRELADSFEWISLAVKELEFIIGYSGIICDIVSETNDFDFESRVELLLERANIIGELNGKEL